MNPPAECETVYVIDDDPFYLKSTTGFLEASGYAVRAYTSAQEFIENLSPEMSGCILTDLHMPGMNGLELQETLLKFQNRLPMVFLSGVGDVPTTVQAMRQGAEDFLTKLSPKEKLLEAINRALERGRREQTARLRVRELRNLFGLLSSRELEVLEQVVLGKMNKQIAADLGINERTVKLHRTNLTRKLQVQAVADLTRMVAEAGLFKSSLSTNPPVP